MSTTGKIKQDKFSKAKSPKTTIAQEPFLQLTSPHPQHCSGVLTGEGLRLVIWEGLEQGASLNLGNVSKLSKSITSFQWGSKDFPLRLERSM